MYIEFEDCYTETKAIELFQKGLTKTEISLRAKQVVDNVLEKGDPLKVAEAVGNLECFIELIKADERFKNYVSEQAGKGFTLPSGTKIESIEAGTKYHYDKCNDPEYEQICQQFNNAKSAKDAREKFLKGIDIKGLELINKETGELYTIYPPYKTSVTSYKLSTS